MDLATTKRIAQDFEKKTRTEDVLIWGEGSDCAFDNFNIPSAVLSGLSSCGFKKASPVQAGAIPLGIYKRDLMVQAKSGTGKSCVFSVIALTAVDPQKTSCQVVVINPSRELACQNTDVISEIGQKVEGLNVQTFIGGTSVKASVAAAGKCHIAVGTPGRLGQLVREASLDLSEAALLVLDEADLLVEHPFYADIQAIVSHMHKDKQVVAVSATYPKALEDFVLEFMKNPEKVVLDGGDPVLAGTRNVILDVCKMLETKEKVKVGEDLQCKYKCLMAVLKYVKFTQALIFCNSHIRANALHEKLAKDGFDVQLFSGRMTQMERTKTFLSMRQGVGKLFVCSDLCARGLDAEGVDFVMNFDLPYEVRTYLHRSGRAGRFGTFGVVMNFVAMHYEFKVIEGYQAIYRFNFRVIDSVETLMQLKELHEVQDLPAHKCWKQTTTPEQVQNEERVLKYLLSSQSDANAESLLQFYTHKISLPEMDADELLQDLKLKALTMEEIIQQIINDRERRKTSFDLDYCTGPKSSNANTSDFCIEEYDSLLEGVMIQPLAFSMKL